MKIRIAREVLNTSDGDTITSLDAMFLHFRDGRHLWEDLQEIEDTEEIKQSGWFDFYSGSRAYNQKCTDLDKLYTDQIYSENSEMHCIRLEVSHSADSSLKLKPDDAKRCLDEPLHVFVENAESDGAFIEAMIYAFGRKELADAHTEGWWKIEHSGGVGEVEKRVEDVHGNQAMAYIFPKIKRELKASPANRILLRKIPGKPVEEQILSVKPEFKSEVLVSHGIPDEAFNALSQNNAEKFIDIRVQYLAQVERDFISSLGIPPAEEIIGETDIDTDEP